MLLLEKHHSFTVLRFRFSVRVNSGNTVEGDDEVELIYSQFANINLRRLLLMQTDHNILILHQIFW